MTLRRVLSAGFIGIGTLHFVAPKSFEAIVPPQVPMSPEAAVAVSGVAEIVGGAAAAFPRLDRFTRLWLTGLLVAVYPANIYWALRPEEVRGVPAVPAWALWARLPLQFVFLWAVWRVTARPAKP